MPRTPNMTIYAVDDPHEGEYRYFYSIDQAARYAKTEADKLKQTVDVVGCEIGFPNKRSFVAALNGSQWCISRVIARTVIPSKRRKLKSP